ncbi:hypothetical protein ACFFIO_04485 [Citricoccus parietis]|uniref:Uncharacterized protein n=1 Tax=Citricoccus parietis TaxID=592307 RepID=A0ABV6F2L1_9MICC
MSDLMIGVVVGAVVALVGAGFLLTAWLSYSGRFRSWVLVRPPLTLTGRYWGLLPMALAGIAVLFVAVFGGLILAVGGTGSAPGGWSLTLTVGLVASLVGAVWTSHRLPRALKPAWYRDWEDGGITEQEVTAWLQERKSGRTSR